MSHPERKQNRLMGYDYSQNGAYFITVCVKDRAEILWKSVGADAHIGPANIMPLVELSWYGQVTEKYLKRIKGIEKYVVCRTIFIALFGSIEWKKGRCGYWPLQFNRIRSC